MDLIKMPDPMVSQAEMALVREKQIEFVVPNYFWLVWRAQVGKEIRKIGAVTGPTATLFYLFSLRYHWCLKRLEIAQQKLAANLAHCGGRYEPGDLKPSPDGFVHGRENYCVEYAVPALDIVAMQKSLKTCRIHWASRNAPYIAELSPAQMTGKTAAEIWPGERGGPTILGHDSDVSRCHQTKIFKETLRFNEIEMERISIRFITFNEKGRRCLAVIGFDISAIAAQPTLRDPRLAKFDVEQETRTAPSEESSGHPKGVARP